MLLELTLEMGGAGGVTPRNHVSSRRCDMTSRTCLLAALLVPALGVAEHAPRAGALTPRPAAEKLAFGEVVRRAAANATSASIAAEEVRRAEALLVEARS